MIPFLSSKGKTTKAKGPAGKICYAIGDVHGRLDLLEHLLAEIEQHRAGRPDLEAHVVLLGDVIDRGPDSRAVLARLRRGLSFEAGLHLLKGNHEDMLVEALSGKPSRLKAWLDNGGYACAQSYGVEIGRLFGQDPKTIEDILLQSIPQDDIAFMDGMLDSIRFGDYFLVHAGVRPGLTLSHQSAHDLKWIREPFLASKADHGAVIVHGHSTTSLVETLPNRIGIDTGAWKTGVLTALWMQDNQRGLIQARGSAPEAQL